MKQEISTLLTQKLEGLGATEVGFCKLPQTAFCQKAGLPLPTDTLPYGISIVVALSSAVIDEIHGKPTHTYFHHYRTVNALLDQLTLQAGLWLQQQGYQYLPIAASQSVNSWGWNYQGRLSHKEMACLCSLGTIGKSDLFLHHQYGPRVRLTSLLTDCPVSDTYTIPTASCGICTACVKACPAQAITGQEWSMDSSRESLFDAEACSQHMKKAYQHIGRGAVCGICVQVCPKGKR